MNGVLLKNESIALQYSYSYNFFFWLIVESFETHILNLKIMKNQADWIVN